jgi:hypothetical protein
MNEQILIINKTKSTCSNSIYFYILSRCALNSALAPYNFYSTSAGDWNSWLAVDLGRAKKFYYYSLATRVFSEDGELPDSLSAAIVPELGFLC